MKLLSVSWLFHVLLVLLVMFVLLVILVLRVVLVRLRCCGNKACGGGEVRVARDVSLSDNFGWVSDASVDDVFWCILRTKAKSPSAPLDPL